MGRTNKEDKSLLAFLKKCDPETLVYLGSKNGSSWMVIDTADNIIKDISTIDNYYRKLAEEYRDRNYGILYRTPRSIVEIQDKLSSGNLDKPDTAKYEQKLENLYKAMFNAYGSRKTHTKALLNWVDFEKRNVVETYTNRPTNAEDKGICVLIDADINGDFWTKAEYELFKKRLEIINKKSNKK